MRASAETVCLRPRLHKENATYCVSQLKIICGLAGPSTRYACSGQAGEGGTIEYGFDSIELMPQAQPSLMGLGCRFFSYSCYVAKRNFAE